MIDAGQLIEQLHELVAKWRQTGEEADRVMIAEGTPYRECADDLDNVIHEATRLP